MLAILALATVPFPAVAQTEVHLWHALEGRLAEVFTRFVDRFNASQKDVRVLASFHGDYPATLKAGLAAADSGKGPHLLQVYEVGTGDLIATPRVFKPAHLLATEWNVRFDREDYFAPIASYYADANGRMLALPFSASTPVLYLNRAAYAKAGLDADKPPRTWQDMQGHLLKLQEAGFTCAYTTAHQTWVHLENLSAWHNQPVASHNNGIGGNRAELQFNSRLMIQHISLLSAWRKSDLFILAGRHAEAERRFLSGECATITASSAALAEYASNGQFGVAVAQIPHHDFASDAPYNTLLGGSALWVINGRPPREYQAVARFLGFLASPAIAAEWHQATGYLPMSRAAMLASQKSGYYDKHPENTVALNQLRGLKPGNFARGVRLRHMADIRAIVDEELDAVWAGSKTPKDALDEAVARGNALLKRVAGTPAAARVAVPAASPPRPTTAAKSSAPASRPAAASSAQR